MTAKIVIASTLKPVWDPRAYEKLGKSLAATGKYKVEIIGSGEQLPEEKNIKFYSLPYSRGIRYRLLIRWEIFRIIIRSQPDLLIITTHELLVLAVLYRLLYGKKVVYDIQENYYFNLLYQDNYKPIVKSLMAGTVRLKEILTAGLISNFLLAENCYLEEIKFLRRRRGNCLVLENKCARIFPLKKTTEESKVQLLMAGTISEIYGVWEAIEFFKELPGKEFELTIIGHCPSRKLKHRIETETASLPGVSLHISTSPIPHHLIGNKYTDRTIGLLPYRANKSIQNKVPTKLFEYQAHRIPILVSPNIHCEEMINEAGGSLLTDFNQPPDIDSVSRSLTLKNNNQEIDLKLFMWNSIENQYLTLIKTILKN